MIAKDAVISHGANAVRYATEKDKSEIVKLNRLPDGVPPEGIWQRMVIHQKQFEDKLNRYRPMKNNAIRIEVSPARDESDGWTHADWERLTEEFIREFDAVDLSKRADRASAARTNLAGSQYVVALHCDSRSGIAHLHIVANRVDREGNVNDAHFIYERAMEAARRINIQRGWLTAEERSEQNRQQIADDCLDVLRQMSRFDWEEYAQRLGRKGYVIDLRRDAKGIVRGYTVGKGNSVYKSSQLGTSRHLTPSKIEQTWRSLHPMAQSATAGVDRRSEAQPAQETAPQQIIQSAEQLVANMAAQPTVQPPYCTLRHRGNRQALSGRYPERGLSRPRQCPIACRYRRVCRRHTRYAEDRDAALCRVCRCCHYSVRVARRRRQRTLVRLGTRQRG